MPVYQLNEHPIFPPITHSENDGLLAIGGDLSIQRLIVAYESGIFPWYSEGQPIMWWSPDPRFVIYTDQIHISRSMKRLMNSEQFQFKINTDFNKVVELCSSVPRHGQDGTWITAEMKKAYVDLYKNGNAFSFETWNSEMLVGGMYGVLCNNYFAGESMFSLESNASKYALIKACQYLNQKGVGLLDCQIHSEHLESMGAESLSRKEFGKYLSIRSEEQ